MPALYGIYIAIFAIILVIARVLWPKEYFAQRRNLRQFTESAQEMQEGLARLEDEQYEAALALFQEAARKTPQKPAPRLLRIYTLGLQGHHIVAQTELHNALKKWSAQTIPPRLLALAFLGAGRYDKAYESAIRAASEIPTTSIALLTLGDIGRLTERYPEAQRAYEGAIRLSAPRPHATLAYVLAAQGKIVEAEAELAAAPRRTLGLFEAQLTLAQIHYQARRLPDALDVYAALYQEHPNVPRVIAPFGLALLEIGEVRESWTLLKSTVQRIPGDPLLHCAMAQLCIEKQDLADAVVHIREALQLWPGYGAARGIYGDILKQAGRYQIAEEQYHEALRVNPFLPEVHVHMAALLRLRGAMDEAREHDREALRLRPDAPIPITQEILAVTTQAVKTGTMPIIVPRSQPSPMLSSDFNVVLTPHIHSLPAAPAELNIETVLLPAAPRMMNHVGTRSATQSVEISNTDITVFPGAILLFDDPAPMFYTQTLQTSEDPMTVRDFYRSALFAEHWQLAQEDSSMISEIRGITDEYSRGSQRALITIGVPTTRFTQKEPRTIIVTYVTQMIAHRSSRT